MKKAIFAVLCLFACAGLKAQTYTSGHLTVSAMDSMVHDSTRCATSVYLYYTITIDTSFTGETVYIVDTTSGGLVSTWVNTTGASPWTFTTGWGGGGTGAGSSGNVYGVHDYGITGGYARTMSYYATKKVASSLDTVIATCAPDSLLVTDPCSYSTVSGSLFIDNNGNCVNDAGDYPLSIPYSDLKVVETFASPGGGYNGWTSGSFSSGFFTINVQQSWVATCSVSVPSYYYFVYGTGGCPAGPYVFTSIPATGADFPFQCTSNVDVQCAALSPASVRLHTPFNMNPYVSNTGCSPASGQMKLILDSRVIYDASLSSHPADAVSGDTLIWNYSGLSNLSSMGYWNSFMSHIHLESDATVVAGDTLCFRVLANIPAADINATNNDYSFCLPVVYSYDPNVKEVVPKGTGPEGNIPGSSDVLNYTLHFQNTGSAPAFTVKVTDELDAAIDPQSLKILGSSHNMSPKWLSANVVQFVYDNINLADSISDEPASHGSVKFSVKLRPGLPIGTQIRNKGKIYFDLNPPVITNTVLNTLTSPTGITELHTHSGVKVYPNPATDRITIEHLEGGELTIVNMSGMVVIKQQITSDKAMVDVSRLPAGIYVLKTSNSVNSNTERFIKY